ncbi:metal ABC transporter solute-binding protein, Zn/Mn family [Bacteroidota bacterium]
MKLSYHILLIALILTNCSFEEQNNIDLESTIKATVSIIPYVDLVKNIGGKYIEVSAMIPPGFSPHRFEPTLKQLDHLKKSDIYFKVGGAFLFEDIFINKQLSNIKNIKVVDCSEKIEIINNNPHIWLNPKNIELIVNQIYKTLAAFRPKLKEYFKIKRTTFMSRLDSIDLYIKSTLKNKTNRKLMVYHDAWIYLTKEYNLETIIIEKENKLPGAKDLKELIANAKKAGTNNSFSDPQFDPGPAQTIANELGIKFDYLDPLPENNLENFEEIARKLKTAIE